MRSSIVGLLLLLLPFAPASAAERARYTTSLTTDLSVIASSGAAILIPNLYADSLIRKRCPCDPGEVNALDRRVIGNANPFLDSLSDGTVGAVMIAPLVLDWADLGSSAEFADDAIVFAEVLSVNGALVTAAKYVAQRPLPRTYAGDANLIASPGGYRSYYSGHASTTFAALSAVSVTLDLRYGAGILPWIGTALIGTVVSTERVLAGRHFITDVAVGALMGTAVGVAVPLLHRSRSAESHFALAPITSDQTKGLALLWTRRF